MKTIRLRAIVLALVATVGVAAIMAATAAARSQATTITLWNTMNDQETVTFKSVLADFEKANPDIDVTLVQVPFDQRETKFSTAVQAGAGPDIMRAEIADVANWASRGLLVDITSKVSAADKQDFLPSAFAYYNYAGKIWGLPQAPDALTIFYNKALFKQRGIKPTQLPKSLAALTSLCQKFPARKGIFLR
ncbi:MAG: extracellular solute-binding protein, partial [Gaiellaceae bacterium]